MRVRKILNMILIILRRETYIPWLTLVYQVITLVESLIFLDLHHILEHHRNMIIDQNMMTMARGKGTFSLQALYSVMFIFNRYIYLGSPWRLWLSRCPPSTSPSAWPSGTISTRLSPPSGPSGNSTSDNMGDYAMCGAGVVGRLRLKHNKNKTLAHHRGSQ